MLYWLYNLHDGAHAVNIRPVDMCEGKNGSALEDAISRGQGTNNTDEKKNGRCRTKDDKPPAQKTCHERQGPTRQVKQLLLREE